MCLNMSEMMYTRMSIKKKVIGFINFPLIEVHLPSGVCGADHYINDRMNKYCAASKLMMKCIA